MTRLFAIAALTALAGLLSACQTYPDPGGNAFLFCDQRAESCYRSCEVRADQYAYEVCQDSCSAGANRCFANANAQTRYASTAVYVDPWIGRYGAWYPTAGYFFSADLYNRYGLRRAYRPSRIVGPRYGYGRARNVPRRVVRPYRDQRPVRAQRSWRRDDGYRPGYRGGQVDRRPYDRPRARPDGGRGPAIQRPGVQRPSGQTPGARGPADRQPQARPGGRQPQGRPEGRQPQARPEGRPARGHPESRPQSRPEARPEARPSRGEGRPPQPERSRGESKPPQEP